MKCNCNMLPSVITYSSVITPLYKEFLITYGKVTISFKLIPVI